MILLIDNYDSFVHNLARYFQELGRPTLVRRNRELTPEDILRLSPRAVVISPGPCDPSRAGVSVPAVKALSGRVPILGICLGHQAIAHALGGSVVRAVEPIHGMASPIHHAGRGIFRGIPSPFQGARYHSLVVSEADLPAELRVSASTPDGRGGRVVMAIRHESAPTIGLQFHPESVLTEHGHRLLRNFIEIADAFHGTAVRERPAAGVLLPQGAAAAVPVESPLESEEEATARATSEAGAARAGLRPTARAASETRAARAGEGGARP